MSKRMQVISVVALLAILLGVRLYGIRNTPYERGEFWRQPDTEAIAHNFVAHGYSILRPELNYDGPLPNVAALEFQVTTSLIALLYSIFGRHYILARLVPVGFFLASCLLLYLFGRRHIGHRGALWATALYGLFPLNIFFSRTIMPDSGALFFMIGAVYCFDLFASANAHAGRADASTGPRDKYETLWLALSALLMALAITQKPQTAFVGVPLLGLAWRKYGWRLFRQVKLWLFAAVALGLPAAFYAYTNSIAEFHIVWGIGQKHVLKDFLRAMFTPGFATFLRQIPVRAFTAVGLALLAAALLETAVSAVMRSRRGEPSRSTRAADDAGESRDLGVIYLWLLGGLLNLITIVAVIKVDYYLLYITPPVALLIGATLGRFRGWRAVVPLACVALVAVLTRPIVLPQYAQVRDVITQGEAVQMVSQPGDLIVTTLDDPTIINASDRQGWRFNIKYYPGIPTDPYKELQYYIDRGAKYFVPLKGNIWNDQDGAITRYLDTHYEKLEPIPGYPIYAIGK